MTSHTSEFGFKMRLERLQCGGHVEVDLEGVEVFQFKNSFCLCHLWIFC